MILSMTHSSLVHSVSCPILARLIPMMLVICSSRSKGPVIEEIDNDDELSEENKDEDSSDAAWANRNPLVEHPEDQAGGNGRSENRSKVQAYEKDDPKIKGTQSQTSGISFQRVTYGGVDGAYYTATTTRRSGEDGVIFEESKHADKTTSQAAHRISRGINDKGHSVTRTLDSDGRIDTMQTLHNLEEDELAGFERVWKSNGDKHFLGHEDRLGFPGNIGAGGSTRSGLTSLGGFADPFRDLSIRNGGQITDHKYQSRSSKGRSKKVIRINID